MVFQLIKYRLHALLCQILTPNQTPVNINFQVMNVSLKQLLAKQTNNWFLKTAAFWDVMMCMFVNSNQYFRETGFNNVQFSDHAQKFMLK